MDEPIANEPNAPEGFPALTPGMTPSMAGAIAMYELFTNMINAGFTEYQAMLFMVLSGAENNRRNAPREE